MRRGRSGGGALALITAIMATSSFMSDGEAAPPSRRGEHGVSKRRTRESASSRSRKPTEAASTPSIRFDNISEPNDTSMLPDPVEFLEDLGPGPNISPQERLALRREEFEAHMFRALRAEREIRWDDAIREYTGALQLEPGNPAALLGRAYAHKHRNPQGRCARRAVADLLLLRTYDPRGSWPQHRGELVAWMGACGQLYATERLALAQELANEVPGTSGRPADIRVLVAKLHQEQADLASTQGEAAAQREAALQELERYRIETRKLGKLASAEALRIQADLHREVGQLRPAISAYRELLKVHALAPEANGADRLLSELEVDVAVEDLKRTQGGRPTERASMAYEAGRMALASGDVVGAESRLKVAIDDSPWFPKAHYYLGVTYARTGQIPQAVEELKQAIRMDRFDYEAHMTLGLLYKREFGGAEDGEAIKHLDFALRLRPDLHHLHFVLGELHARDSRERARWHFERFIESTPDGDPDGERARRAYDELSRDMRENEPKLVPPLPDASLRFLDPELQRMINEAYVRGTEHQDWDRSEKILRDAQARYPSEFVVLNELAKVAYAQERPGSARQFWEQSLAMKEDQWEVHERLGFLLEGDLPEEATPHFRRAADLGSVRARFALANLLWHQNELFDASAQIDHYLRESGPDEMYWDRAQSQRERLDAVFLKIYLTGGLLLAVLLALPAWRIYRRLRGASLAQMLERAPKSFPDVARILSLVRHEILKHNTAFLGDVGGALELDQTDAETRAAILGRRLFGDAHWPQRQHSLDVPARAASRFTGSLRRSRPHRGIYGRFLGYLDELQKVARTHGITLNLHRKDAIFSPMIATFEALARQADALRNPYALRPKRKLELARLLSRAGHVLGRQAFQRLSGLIQSLCVVHVDSDLVMEIYKNVAAEQQFAGHHFAALEVRGSGAMVRIFRTDFEDILTNVLRNSLRSSLLYATPPVGLAIDLVTEIDEITGLTTLAARIKDRSPEQLSNEMLRGRYVERGMGITVDLLSRYDGSIGVEPETGWQKAVVLRFFTLEG